MFDWGPVRYGPILFLVGAPFALALLTCLIVHISRRVSPLKPFAQCVANIVLSTGMGVLVALWVSCLPCLYYICDGGPWDNLILRFVLMWLIGPFTSALSSEFLCLRVCCVARGPKNRSRGVVAVENSDANSMSGRTDTGDSSASSE